VVIRQFAQAAGPGFAQDRAPRAQGVALRAPYCLRLTGYHGAALQEHMQPPAVGRAFTIGFDRRGRAQYFQHQALAATQLYLLAYIW